MLGRIGFGGGDQNRLVSRHQKANQQLNRSVEKLASGKRINRAQDDPAGLIAATQIQAELASMEAEQRNASLEAHRSAILDTAQGQVGDVLQNAYGLISSAADGLLSDEQRSALQVELDASIESISRIQSYISKYQPDSGLDLTALQRFSSAGDLNVIDGNAAEAQSVMKEQLSTAVQARAKTGIDARTNEVLSEVRQEQMIQQHASLSQIQDLDFAAGVSELQRSQTLVQSSLLALQYYNQNAGSSLSSLLGGINIQV